MGRFHGFEWGRKGVRADRAQRWSTVLGFGGWYEEKENENRRRLEKSWIIEGWSKS